MRQNSYHSLQILQFLLVRSVYVTLFVYDFGFSEKLKLTKHVQPMDFADPHHQCITMRFYTKRNAWKTSNLGTILFKNVSPEIFLNHAKVNKTYAVLTWGFDRDMGEQVNPFTPDVPIWGHNFGLEDCSVKNCNFTTSKKDLDTADVVVIGSHIPPYPEAKQRQKRQTWVIYTYENPVYMMPPGQQDQKSIMKYFASVANFTMNYRFDADVPLPYGRTIPLSKPMMTEEQFKNASLAKIIPHWTIKRNDVLASILLRRHTPTRKKLLEKLSEYLNVDIYGPVATNESLKHACPGYYNDCKPTFEYIFYLAFENAECNQYLTDKIFYHSYFKGSIPIIWGAPLKDCEDLLPPNSFIHVDQFDSVEELAMHMKNIAVDTLALRNYHRWRNNFEVVNEFGVFGTPGLFYCRLCEALNYNDGHVRTYSEDKIKYFFDENLNCKMDLKKLIKNEIKAKNKKHFKKRLKVFTN